MEWDNGATIGFNSAEGDYANNDPSSSEVACLNSPDSVWSNVIFRLSSANPEFPAPGKVYYTSESLLKMCCYVDLYFYLREH